MENIKTINEAIVSKNLPLLQQLSRNKKGFVNDGIRRRVWPLLLNIDLDRYKDRESGLIPTSHNYSKESHRDCKQVELDVLRSHIDHRVDEEFRNKLSSVINAILYRNPCLYYYQGYHDVMTVFIRVLGESCAFLLGEKSSILYFRDYMMPDLKSVTAHLNIIFPLLKIKDPSLHSFIVGSEATSYFAVSWLLTWCSHNIEEYSIVARIFDFFLSSNPLMPIYFITTVRKKYIIQGDSLKKG
jgi:hypothetical protein